MVTGRIAVRTPVATGCNIEDGQRNFLSFVCRVVCLFEPLWQPQTLPAAHLARMLVDFSVLRDSSSIFKLIAILALRSLKGPSGSVHRAEAAAGGTGCFDLAGAAHRRLPRRNISLPVYQTSAFWTRV